MRTKKTYDLAELPLCKTCIYWVLTFIETQHESELESLDDRPHRSSLALAGTDPLVCLLGPLALTGPQLDYVEDRRREGGAERRSQHEVVLAILGEADWAIPIPDERPRTHYQTQGELRIPAWMVVLGDQLQRPEPG